MDRQFPVSLRPFFTLVGDTIETITDSRHIGSNHHSIEKSGPINSITTRTTVIGISPSGNHSMLLRESPVPKIGPLSTCRPTGSRVQGCQDPAHGELHRRAPDSSHRIRAKHA